MNIITKPILKMILRMVLKRLAEASTWRGIILGIGGAYTVQNSELVEAIIPVCLALVGLIGAVMPDKNKVLNDFAEKDDPKEISYTPSPRDTGSARPRDEVKTDSNSFGGFNG